MNTKIQTQREVLEIEAPSIYLKEEAPSIIKEIQPIVKQDVKPIIHKGVILIIQTKIQSIIHKTIQRIIRKEIQKKLTSTKNYQKGDSACSTQRNSVCR